MGLSDADRASRDIVAVEDDADVEFGVDDSDKPNFPP